VRLVGEGLTGIFRKRKETERNIWRVTEAEMAREVIIAIIEREEQMFRLMETGEVMKTIGERVLLMMMAMRVGELLGEKIPMMITMHIGEDMENLGRELEMKMTMDEEGGMTLVIGEAVDTRIAPMVEGKSKSIEVERQMAKVIRREAIEAIAGDEGPARVQRHFL